MSIIFTEDSWEDYLYWQKNDKKILQRINEIIRDIRRELFVGIGKPEPLKFQLQGCWSRRINQEHRLVYEVSDTAITIIGCRFHY